MRITAFAVAVLLASGVARTTLGQAPASAKNLGVTTQSQPAPSGPSLLQRRLATQAACVAANQPQADPQAFAQQPGAVQQVVMLVPQQLPDGQQALFMVPQDATGANVQLVGHHQFGAACPCNQYGGQCAGGGYGGPWNGGYGGPYAGMNGGFGYGQPGGPFNGGGYGPWGGRIARPATHIITCIANTSARKGPRPRKWPIRITRFAARAIFSWRARQSVLV